MDIRAFIGPSISREHFEVSEATADIFRRMGPAYARCVYETADTVRVDLWQANQQLLLEAGLLAQHIDTTTHCAYQYERDFYSYRRDGGHTGKDGSICHDSRNSDDWSRIFSKNTSIYKA